jgi:hypothetical protein
MQAKDTSGIRQMGILQIVYPGSLPKNGKYEGDVII